MEENCLWCLTLQRPREPTNWLALGHKLPAARARELFKPSTDSPRCLVDIENKLFVFGLAFAGVNVTSGGVFAFFWLPIPGPGPQPIDPFFWLKFVSETRQKSASLEPLNGFLAYL